MTTVLFYDKSKSQMKRFLILLVQGVFLIEAVCVFAKETQTDFDLTSERLRQNTHRLETAYQFSQVPSGDHQKVTLQNFLIGGGFALTPEVTAVGKIPLMTLSGSVAIGNPFLGVEALLYEGLLKEFPTFVFFNGGDFRANDKFLR